MSVYETELPGVGKKFEVDIGDQARVVVVIHHSGRREIFLRDDPEADVEKLFELDDQLARQLGSILEGAYFQPVATVPMETMLGDDAIMDWIQIPEGSELSGRTLGEANLRQRTGATVLAVKRTEHTTPNPDPDLTLEVGDVLVVLGSREEVQKVEALAGGS